MYIMGLKLKRCPQARLSAESLLPDSGMFFFVPR
jgi:hypothetical protein